MYDLKTGIPVEELLLAYEENKQLKERIDKIKELINNFIKDNYIKGNNQLNLTEILEILKGEENE